MQLNASLAVAATLGALLLSALTAPVAAAELPVYGAATVARGIIVPNQAAIEQETGLTLIVTANGDGNGLRDLYAGRADVAMIEAQTKPSEETLARAIPGSTTIADFQVSPVGKFSIHFVVNPANPVKSLPESQLRDNFSGKITSWKDVGWQ
jgi:phosphate transport system substrate-binding protein